MCKHDPRVTLQQLREAAQQAAELCSGHTLAEIEADWIKRLAFERCFGIVGEAIKRLPPELRARYAENGWRNAAGTRDRIAHGYDAVDHETLWKEAQEKFPGFVRHDRADAERPRRRTANGGTARMSTKTLRRLQTLAVDRGVDLFRAAHELLDASGSNAAGRAARSTTTTTC